jgi:hypothetical protein
VELKTLKPFDKKSCHSHYVEYLFLPVVIKAEAAFGFADKRIATQR